MDDTHHDLPGLRVDLAEQFREIKRRHIAGEEITGHDIEFLIDLVESGIEWGNKWMDEWLEETRKINKLSPNTPSTN